MRKIFTFLCAALMSVGMFATTVTWNSSTLSSIYLNDGESFTQDGVTVTSLTGMIEGAWGNWMGYSNDASFKFSTSLGNFTKIEITGNINELAGSGWTQTSPGAVWTGDANETTFGMYFDNVSQIVFTIGEPAPTTYTLKLVADPIKGSVAVTNLLGSDIVDNGNGNYTVPENTKVTILATPNEGYAFTGWLEGNVLCDFIDCGTAINTLDNPLTFTMTNDAACKAEFAAVAPQPATTVVTITDSDFPAWGDSFTKDGVTVSAEMLDGMYGNISGPGSFSTTLGNFTKIEIFAEDVSTISGEGWSGDSEHKTWTGNASSVSFTGDINGNEEGTTLKFTIEAASTPEPAGEVTVVFAANNKTVERTVTLPHDFSCSYSNRDGELDAIIKELYEISAGHCSDDNYPVASGNEAVVAGSNGFDNYITISAAFEGTATVSGWYWNSDAYDGDGDWMDYTLTISIKGTPTAVENVQTNHVQGTKFFRDGMLLIEKNGKIYNVQGVEVR